MGPQIYLLLALACAVPATYGAMKVKLHRAEIAAYGAGKAVGAEMAGAAVTKKAAATVAAVAAGEASAQAVPADKAKIVDLCKRSASCRDRAR